MNRLNRCVVLCLFVISLVWANDASRKNDRIILTSFYPVYIAALNVAQGVPNVKVVNMTKPQTGCLHDYQLTPQDMKTLSTAWVFVVNGGGMESFIDKAVKQQPALKIVEASKGVDFIRGTDVHKNTLHRTHPASRDDHLDKAARTTHYQDHDEELNPHVWVSVSGAIEHVKNIRDGLIALDTAHASVYRSNGDAYIAKLEALKTKMHAGLSGISSRNIITFHEAFPYFAKEFNLTIAAVIEREPGSEPSAGELAKTVKIVKSHKVKALFAEPQYPAKAAQTIARETGAKLYILDPVVTGPLSPDAYVRIMESNLAVLQEALK